MKKLFNYSVALLVIATLNITSCKKGMKEDEITTTKGRTREKDDIATNAFYGTNPLPVLLGAQLQNPYTISNMTLAVNTLANAGTTIPINVRVTHEYVKFSPKSTAELQELKKDADFILYDYPLDYKIERSGNWYRDPSIREEERPTFHYASVKLGYHYNPKIEYEVLEKLYIPEEDEELIGIDHRHNLEYLDKLQEQAYLQTENVEAKQRYSWYTPAGTITIYDIRLQQNIPLEGVKITANRWFTTYTSYTDANGHYAMNDQFKRPCDYKLYFQRTGFVIGDNWLQQAKIGHDNRHGDWNYNIGVGYENMQGHMFRGAYRYYYQDVKGLKRPFRPNGNESWIVAKNSSKDWSGVNYIVFPILKVARFNSSSAEYHSDEFFSTTCHELAHSTHVLTMNSLGDFVSVPNWIKESWAVGVEWQLTGLEYKSKGITNYGEVDYHPNSTYVPEFPNDRAYQLWFKSVEPTYTNIFINLIDNVNESTINLGTPLNPIFGNPDLVSGYDLGVIQSNYLNSIGATSIISNNFLAKLKANKPVGVTDAQLDNLFNFY